MENFGGLSLEPMEESNNKRESEATVNAQLAKTAENTGSEFGANLDLRDVNIREKITLGNKEAIEAAMSGIPEEMMGALKLVGYDEAGLLEELKEQAKAFPADATQEEVTAGLKLFIGNRLKN